MTMGLGLKGLNNLYFRDFLELLAETIPQLVFLLSAFGFMVYLIVYKWLSGATFSIITMLVNNPLSYLMGGVSTFSPLEHTQLQLLLLAGVMVPVILFLKPIVLIYCRKPSSPPGDIFVHQVIETIEFVLGSVSNTASYLRLWALSLAHNQLSRVFFDNCLTPGLRSPNFLVLVGGYFVFANITFAVILCMDTMECFLHALRLHWYYT